MIKKHGKLSGCGLLILLIIAAIAPPSAAKPVIVIDPGHGGRDTGVIGRGGIEEKQVTLALAEKVSKQLEASCTVYFTRTGDYRLSPPERLSIANHFVPDLFISLHAGASYRRAIDRWAIYHAPDERPEKTGFGRQHPVKWSELQQRHLESSQKLALCLRDRLHDRLGADPPDITPAPVPVLQGAQMPAVLIEAGYLTHPAAERRLADVEWLSEAARGIAEGISEYLKNNGRIR